MKKIVLAFLAFLSVLAFPAASQTLLEPVPENPEKPSLQELFQENQEFLSQSRHPDLPELLERAASGDPEADFRLGEIFRYGLHVPENGERAILHFQRAAEGNHSEAHLHLMDLRNSVPGLGSDFHLAESMRIRGIEDRKELSNLTRLRKLADAGSSFARLEVARHYLDLAKNLGSRSSGSYGSSHAVPIFLRKAAEDGEPGAMQELANWLDPEKAIPWMVRAAEAGLLAPQVRLGIGHHHRIFGMPRNRAIAERWLETAALRGDVRAQEDFGRFLHKGLAGEDRKPESLRFFHLAANQGNLAAQIMMGGLHLDGKIVPRDVVIAYSWLHLAAPRDSDPKTRQLLEKVERGMTPQQIDQAQARSRELDLEIRKMLESRK